MGQVWDGGGWAARARGAGGEKIFFKIILMIDIIQDDVKIAIKIKMVNAVQIKMGSAQYISE